MLLSDPQPTLQHSHGLGPADPEGHHHGAAAAVGAGDVTQELGGLRSVHAGGGSAPHEVLHTGGKHVVPKTVRTCSNAEKVWGR